VIGQVVGGYRIVSRLGGGGTGEVFGAEHASVATKAAVKIIAPALASDPGRLQTYLKQAQAASRIGNQGTVKITEVGMPAGYGHGFLVMELLQGETLAKRIARTKRLSITQIAEVGRQLATVIAAMHDDNLVHRDLRPDKIFLVRDSGLAQEKLKVLVGDALLLGPTHEKGAPYAAPELWRGEPGDWRADIYAFGCMIFEMATGQRPFAGTPSELGAKHAEYQIPAARSLMPDVPPVLDGLIARLMAKSVDQRPKSMREIARELDAIGGTAKPLAPTVRDEPVGGEMQADTLPPGPPPERIDRKPPSPAATARMREQKSKVPLIVVLALLLAIGGAVAIVLATR
jgi:serine/threonine-protein kinase